MSTHFTTTFFSLKLVIVKVYFNQNNLNKHNHLETMDISAFVELGAR